MPNSGSDSALTGRRDDRRWGGSSEEILLIRFKSIGDVLFTLPAVRRLRECFPDARITFLVSRENAPLLEGFGDIQSVLTLDRARLRGGNPVAVFREVYSLLRRLRRGRFSLAVDFQGYGETALLTRWSGAPRRWGVVYSRWRRWAYTQAMNRVNTLHPIEGNLRLLEQCGVPSGTIRNEFALPDHALAAAREFFLANQLAPDAPTLYLQPFTSSPQKNWPLQRYLELARHGQRVWGQVVFGGGPADRAALEAARQAGFPVAAGQPLLVASGLMKLSTLIVGGDTGLLHLAVAMGKRVVMIMNSARPGRPFPFRHPDWAVTPPAGGVQGVGARTVIDLCQQAFAQAGATERHGDG